VRARRSAFEVEAHGDLQPTTLATSGFPRCCGSTSARTATGTHLSPPLRWIPDGFVRDAPCRGPSPFSQRRDRRSGGAGRASGSSAVGRTSIPKAWAHLMRAHVELPHREPGRAPAGQAEHRSVDDPLVQRLARPSRAWARAIRAAYPDLEGLRYRSSMYLSARSAGCSRASPASVLMTPRAEPRSRAAGSDAIAAW